MSFINNLAGVLGKIYMVSFYEQKMVVRTMTLQVYNSLSKTLEPFIPVTQDKVKMYVCGMTVYSDAHIGHARTYFAFDMIRRYLEYKGFEVFYVQNITDVDDKIILASEKDNVDPLVYSAKFADRCLSDLDALGIRRANLYPKASETIEDMITMIQEIMNKGYAYETDGDVYFSVERFNEYGKLSGQNIEELMSGTRIATDEKKQSPLDFALWKHTKPGEPFWESPWGNGRPGWHIECSAMSSKFLGLPFDIHGGGMDLRFPHHENEIAQAEAATGKQFANYWMHCGLLTIEGEKMSKSIGNIINIKDLIKEWNPEVIRFFFAQTHYRKPPDYSQIALSNAEKALERLYRFKQRAEFTINNSEHAENRDPISSKEITELTTSLTTEFEQAMDDDFNTPEAIAAIFAFVNKANKYFEEQPSPDIPATEHMLNTFTRLCQVITLLQDEVKPLDKEEQIEEIKQVFSKYSTDNKEKNSAEEMLTELLQIREQARQSKDWGKADAIRDDIESLGFEVQDTDQGPLFRKRA